MVKQLEEIIRILISEIDPEKIFFLNMGSLYYFVIVWNKEISSFEKRIFIRRKLNTVDVPFDISVYSSEGLAKAFNEQNFLTIEVVQRGKVLYEKK